MYDVNRNHEAALNNLTVVNSLLSREINYLHNDVREIEDLWDEYVYPNIDCRREDEHIEYLNECIIHAANRVPSEQVGLQVPIYPRFSEFQQVMRRVYQNHTEDFSSFSEWVGSVRPVEGDNQEYTMGTLILYLCGLSDIAQVPVEEIMYSLLEEFELAGEKE